MAFQQGTGTRHYGPATARVLLHHIRHGEKGQGWLVIAAAAVAVLSLMIAAAAGVLFFMSKNSEAGQIRQLQQELAQKADQSAVNQVQASSDSQYRTLSGKVTTIGNAVSYFTQFSTACTQDFTGPNGPAEYWFPCTAKLPG